MQTNGTSDRVSIRELNVSKAVKGWEKKNQTNMLIVVVLRSNSVRQNNQCAHIEPTP